MTTTTVHVLWSDDRERPLGVYRTYELALRALNERNGLMRIIEYEVQG